MDFVNEFLSAVSANPKGLASALGRHSHDDDDSTADNKQGLLRAVYWRFFSGLLDSSKSSGWLDQLNKNRETYTQRRDELMKDPSKNEDLDLDTCNPLSMEDDNPYQEFYKVQQLVEETRNAAALSSSNHELGESLTQELAVLK